MGHSSKNDSNLGDNTSYCITGPKPEIDEASKTYKVGNHQMIIARGNMQLLDLSNIIASAASSMMADKYEDSLLLAGDARTDSKTGESTLIFNAPNIEFSKSAGDDVQGAHGLMWNKNIGVTRLWDGVILPKGKKSS